MSGSGLFSAAKARLPSMVKLGQGGLAGEIADLREDVRNTLAPLACLVVDEFTNAAASTASNVMAATASQVAARTLLPGAAAQGVLTNTILASLASAPRQLTFTTAGATPAHQPAFATIHGKDERGRPQVEKVDLRQTAGAFTSTLFFSDVDKIELAGGEGTGATLAIGLGTKIGLSRKLVKRAGRAAVLQEVSGGSVVTNGTFATAADGTAASVTGTANLVDGTPTLPTTETLVLVVDGGDLKTVTFASPANLAAIVSAINTAVGATVAAAGGAGSKFLVLTSPTTGVNSSLDIRSSSTSLTILGLTAGVTKGLGNGVNGAYTPAAALDGTVDFAVYYEAEGE